MSVPARGFRGRGRGGAVYVQAPPEWRATTVQACGLWPFAAGTGSPMVGVPIGRNLLTGATVCCDPISWFTRARLINNPSMWVQGIPGAGKSALVKRVALGLTGYGAQPLILGDLKPDYLPLIRALDGQVIPIGRGRGTLNVLDISAAVAASERLTGRARAELVADARGRRRTLVSALLTVLRGEPIDDREEQVLHRALTLLDERHGSVPVLEDLVRLIDSAPPELRKVVRDRDDLDRYRDATEPLVQNLAGLTGTGRLGDVFATRTSTPIRRGEPLAFDLSSIDDGDLDLQRAALLACWAAGFGSVAISHALADAGLEPHRPALCVLDEAWRAIRGGRGMVDKIDALTRLNRTRGVGTVLVTHSMRDLEALPDKDDRAKARGFVERSGIVACAALPDAEMPLLASAVGLTGAERRMVTGWNAPAAWDATAAADHAPGLGCFLLKVGGRPGIPVRVELTDTELAITDTNHRWKKAA